MARTFGCIPEKILHASFPYMKPEEYLSRNRTFYDRILDEGFVQSFRSIDRWASDNIPFPGRVFQQFMGGCYQRNELARGVLGVAGTRVDLSRVRCPVLNIYAAKDHIVPPETARKNGSLLTGTTVTDREYEASHITVTAAHPIRETVWADTVAWLDTV